MKKRPYEKRKKGHVKGEKRPYKKPEQNWPQEKTSLNTQIYQPTCDMWINGQK